LDGGRGSAENKGRLDEQEKTKNCRGAEHAAEPHGTS